MKPTGYKDTTKRDRTPYWGQIQRWLVKAKTPEQWIETFNMLSPMDQWTVLSRYTPVPKEISNENSGLQVILNLSGVDIRPLQGKVIQSTPILQEHDPDHKI